MNQNDLQEIWILWISIPSVVQDEGGTAFDPHFVQHCSFYCQQCELQCNSAVLYSTSVYTVHCSFDSALIVNTAECRVIRQSIVPLRWASVPLRWAQQRVKRSSHPQRCRWWSWQTRWKWQWFPDTHSLGVVALANCVNADDDTDGVTLKDYEVEESGEYADCYHKTT